MMCKLRVRFGDFYIEYGCFLKTVVIVQAISLIIQTPTNILLYFDDSLYKFYRESNGVTKIILAIIYNIVTFIVPILTQLSCLIFGWIRLRRGPNQIQSP